MAPGLHITHARPRAVEEVIGMTSNGAGIALSRRVALAAALAALAAGPGAQPRRAAAGPVRLGILSASSADPMNLRTQIEPLRKGLRELGYVEGRNPFDRIALGRGQVRSPASVAGRDLLRTDPHLLLTTSPRPALLAKERVKTLPIVAVGIDDPVRSGLAFNLTRPGGNITGISAAFTGLMQKRLQLLKDILPAARRFAIVFNPNTLPRTEIERGVASWEPALAVALQLEEVRGPDDFEPAFASIARTGTDAVAIVADPMIWIERARLGLLCTENRLPSIWGGAGYLDAGGLLSYQGDWSALFYRAAVLVDKILKGTPPGEIPFEQGTKLELVVNLKAARALGIAMPRSVLVSADEVIE